MTVRIFGPHGEAVSTKDDRLPLFVVFLNKESGNAEIMDNQELIARIPVGERRRIVEAVLKMAPVSFKVPTDA